MKIKTKPKSVHPAKKIFIDSKVKFIDVAYTLGVTYGHFMNVMNGTYKPSQALEKKINDIVEGLKNGK